MLTAQNKLPSVNCSHLYFQKVIETLAHDSMQGRLPGTNFEKKAAIFIQNEFKKTGCKPLQKNNFIFPFAYKNPDSIIVQSAGNVVAKIDTKSEYAIVITAHYDHIGHGELHSNDPFSKLVHNGADDNASGVAMMLGIASWCKKQKKQLRYDMIFIGFSGEEDGLFGSEYFLEQKLIDTSKIICNINFDMVGHLDMKRPRLEIDGALETKAWNNYLPKDTNEYFIAERSMNMIKGGSDNCNFLKANIPAVLITTGITGFYHRPQDDPTTINYEGMVAISDYTQKLILLLNQKKDLQLFLK
jgi:Zn-dependent M28 family amino/carboxypeptidase